MTDTTVPTLGDLTGTPIAAVTQTVAVSPLGWSSPQGIDHLPPLQAGAGGQALSCPTTTFCATVAGGDIVTSTDPTSSLGPPAGWRVLDISGLYPAGDDAGDVNDISCPTANVCVAVDDNGNVVTSTDPSGDLSAWRVTSVAPGVDLLGIACPTANFCVGVGRGPHGEYTLTSDEPTDGPAAWGVTQESVFGSEGPNAVSCPGTTLCLAAGSDDAGISTVWTSVDPLDGGSAVWTQHQVGTLAGSDFLHAACPASTLCLAVGSKGQVASSADPGDGATAVWSNESVANTDLGGISCPTTTLCLTLDLNGDVLTSTDPASPRAPWAEKAVAPGLLTVSCPTTSLCVGVPGLHREVFTTTDPVDGAAATWKATGYVASSQLSSVSCPSPTFCAAVDEAGNLVTSTDAASSAPTWTQSNVDNQLAVNPGGSFALEGISCPSTTLCVAVSDNVILTTTDPTGTTPTWTRTPVAGAFVAVSCPSTTVCVALDFDGNVVGSSNPTGGASAWHTTDFDDTGHVVSISCPSTTLCFAGGEGGSVTTIHLDATGAVTSHSVADVDLGVNALFGISCPTTSLCVAVDSAGNVETSTDPTGAASAWTRAKVDPAGNGLPSNTMNGISCATASLCVAVDAVGNVVATTNPTGGASAWAVTPVDRLGAVQSSALLSPGGLDAVSCATTNLCVAVDGNGNSVVGTLGGTELLSVARAGTGSGSITAGGGTIDCPPTCSHPYASGSVVDLTATADPGSTFTGWSGDCSGTGTCQVTMTTARQVTATFSLSGSKTPTTTTATVDPVATNRGLPVDYSATVAGSGGTPTGTVTFSVGPLTLCTTGALASGTGSCTSTAAPVGTDTVSATYSGDADFSPSVGSTTLVVTSGPYTPLTPLRICDTRAGNLSKLSGEAAQCNGADNAGGTLGTGDTLNIKVAGAVRGPRRCHRGGAQRDRGQRPGARGTSPSTRPGPPGPRPRTSTTPPGPGVPNLVEVGTGTGRRRLDLLLRRHRRGGRPRGLRGPRRRRRARGRALHPASLARPGSATPGRATPLG